MNLSPVTPAKLQLLPTILYSITNAVQAGILPIKVPDGVMKMV
jgi:hypothetical protein